MAITVAALQAKMGYNDDELERGLDGSSSKISKFGDIAKASLKLTATAVAAGLAAVGASVVTMEDALTPLMTMTGKNTEQFKAMEKAVKDVMKSSPHSAAELGNAAYEILGAGITDATKAHETLIAANKLSLAGLGPIGDSVDLITSAMNAWRSENITGEQAAKTLFGTISVGKGTIADFSRGFGSIAPLAANVGVSFKELMAATATLTTSGLPASEAYTGLRAAFSNILKPTKEASGVAESLGITMGASGLKAKGLAGYIADVAEKSGGSTDTLVSLFGSMEAVNAIMGLTGPNAEAFAQAFLKIDEAGGNLDQTAKDVSETFSNRIKIMKNNTIVHLQELGIKGLDWLSDKWKAWGPSIISAYKSFTSELDGIGGKPIGVFAQLGDAMGKVRNWIEANWPAIKDTILNTLKGVAEWIGNNWPGVRDTLLSVFHAVKDWIDDNWPSIKEAILNTFIAIKTWIDENWPGIKETFLTVFYAIKKWVDENWPAIRQTLVDGFNTVKDIVITVANAVKEHWPTIKNVIADVVGLVLPLLELWRVMWTETMNSWKNMWDTVGKPTIDAVGWAFEKLAPLIQASLSGIKLAIEIFSAVLKGDWQGAWDSLKDIFSNAWNGVRARIEGAFNALAGLVDTLYWKGIEIMNGFLSGMQAKVWEVYNFIAGVPGRAAGYVGYLGDHLWGAGVSLIQGLIGGIQSMAGRAADAARNVVTNAISAAWRAVVPGSPSKEGRAIGRNFGEGLIAGMQDRTKLVSSVAANMAGAMVSATQYNYSIGGPGNVQVNMPSGSNGNDVVRALKEWQSRNGKVPIAVTGRQ